MPRRSTSQQRPSAPVAVGAAGPSPPETCPPLHALSDATTTVSPSSRLAVSTAADARGSLNAGVPTTEFSPRQPPPSTRQRRPHAANAVEGSHTAAAVGVHLHGSASTISIPLLQSHSVKADGRVGSGSGNNGSSNSCSSRHRSSTSPVSAASSSSRAEGHSNTTATLSSASPLHQEQGSDSDGGLAPSSRGPWRQGRRGSFHGHTAEGRQRREEERKDNNNNNDDDDGEGVNSAHRPMKRHATAPLMSLPFMLNRRTRTDAPSPSPAPAASLSNAERTTAADSFDFTLTSNATLLLQRGRVAVADAMEDVSDEATVATLAPRRTNTMVTLPTQRRLQEQQQQQQRSGQHHSTQPAGGSTRRTPRWGTEEALSLVSPSTLVLAQPQPSKRAARGTLQDSYDSLMLESIPRVSSASTTAGGTTADSVMNASKPAAQRSHERRASPGASLESDVDAVRRNRRARDEERPAAAPSLLLSLLSVSNTEGGSCQPQARVRTGNNKKRVAQQQQQQRRVEGGEGRGDGGVSAGNSAASVSDAVSASTTSSTTPTATRATQQQRQGGGKRGKKGRNTTTDTDTDRRVVAPPAAQLHQHDHRGDAASTAHSGRSEGVVWGSLGSSHYGRKRAPVSVGDGDGDAGGRSRRPSATEPELAVTTPAAAAAAERKRQEQGVGVSRRTSATKKKTKKNTEGRRGAAMEDRSVGAQGSTNTAEKRTKKANRRRGSALKRQEAEEVPPDTYSKTAFARASDTHTSALSASSSASASGSVSAFPVEASCDDGDLSVAASAVSSSSSSLLSSPSSMLLPSTRLAAPQRTRKTTLATQSKQRQRSSRVVAERRESTSMSRSGSDPATASASGAAEFTMVRVPPRSHLPRKAPALSPRQTGLPLLSFPAVLTEKATTPLGQRRKAQPVSTSTSISASTSTNSSSHATTLSAVSPGSQACPTPAAGGGGGGGGGRRHGVGKCDCPQPQQQFKDEHHQSLSAVVRRVSVQQQQQHRLSYASTFLVSSLSSGPSQSTLNDTLTTAIAAATAASSSLSPPPPPQSVSATHSPHRLVDASTPDATTTTAATSPSRGGEEAPHGMSSGGQPTSAVRAHPLPSIPVLSSASISAPTAAAPTTTATVLTKGASGREETDAAASTTPLDTNPHTPKSRQPSFTRSRGQLQAKPPARSPSSSSSASTSFSRSLVSSGTPQSAEQLTPLPVPHEFMRSAGGDRAAQHYSQSQQNPQQARSTTFMMPLMRFASRDSSSTTSSPPPPPPAPPPPESPPRSAAYAGQVEHEKSATSAGNHCPGRVDGRSSCARRQGQASAGRLVPLSDNPQSPALPDPRFLRSPLFAADRSGGECALSLDTLGVAAATALPHTQIEEDDDGIGQTRAFPLHDAAAGESTASASLTAPQVIARVLFASATPAAAAAAAAASDTSHSRFPQPQQQEREMDLRRHGQQCSLTSFSDTLFEETTTAAAVAAAALASTCKGVDAAAALPPPDLKAENPSLRSAGSDGVNDSSMSSFAAPPRSPLELNRSRLRTAGSVAITTRIGHHGEPTSAVASPLLATTTTTATTTAVARASGGRRPVTPPTYVSPLGTSPLPRGGAMGRSPLPFHSVARASGGASPLPLPRGAAASMALVNGNGGSAPLSGGSSPLTLATATAQPGTPPLAPQHIATVTRTSVNASLATSNSLSAFTLAVNGGRGQGGLAGTGSSGNGSGGGGVEVLRESGSGSSSQLCAPVAAAGAADPRASCSVFSSSSVTAITPLVAVRAASPVFPSLGFAPHSGRGFGSQSRGGAGSNNNNSSSPHPPFAVIGSAAAAAAAVVPSSSLHNTSQLLSHHRLVNSFSTTSSMGAFVLQSSNTALLMRNGVPHGTTQVALPDRSGESGTLSASDDMLTGGHALLASFTQRSASRGRQLSRRGTALSVKHPSFVRRGHRRSLLPPGTAIELAIRNGGYSRRPSTLSVMPGGGGHAGAMVTSGGLGRSRNVSALYHSWGDAEPMDVSLSCAATFTATPTSASASYISSSFGSVSQVLSAPRHNSASGALTADGAGSAGSAATRVTSNTTGEIIHNSISISGSSASAGVATARTQAAVHTCAPPKAAAVTLLHTNAGGSDKAGMSRELWNAEGNNNDHHHQQQKADGEHSDQLLSPTGPSCVLYSTAPRRYHFYRLKKKTATSTAATKSNNPDALCSQPHSGDAYQRQHSLEKTYTSPLQLPRYQQGCHGGLAVASTLSPNEGGLTPSQQQPQPTWREREKRHHRYVRIHHRKHTSQLPLPSLRDPKGGAATRSVEDDSVTAAVAAEGEQEAVKMEGGDVATSGMNARRMEDRDAEAHSNSNSSSTAPPSAAVGRQQLNNTAVAVDSTAHDHSSSILDSPHRLTLSPPPSASQQQQQQQERAIYSPHLSTSSLLYYDDVDSDAVDDVYYQLEKRLFPVKAEQALQARKASLLSASACSHRLYVPPLTTEGKATTSAAAEVAGMSGDTVPSTSSPTAAAATIEVPTAVDTQSKITSLFTVLDVPLRLNLRGGFHLSDYYAPCPICHPVMTKLAAAAAAAAAADISTSTLTDSDEIVSAESGRGSDGSSSSDDDDDDADESDLCSCSDCSNCGSRSPAAIRSRRRRHNSSSRGKQRRAVARGASLSSSTVTSRRSSETTTTTHTRSSASAASSVISATGIGFAFHSGAGLTGEGFSPPPPPSTSCAAAAAVPMRTLPLSSATATVGSTTVTDLTSSPRTATHLGANASGAVATTPRQQSSTVAVAATTSAATTSAATPVTVHRVDSLRSLSGAPLMAQVFSGRRSHRNSISGLTPLTTATTTAATAGGGGSMNGSTGRTNNVTIVSPTRESKERPFAHSPPWSPTDIPAPPQRLKTEAADKSVRPHNPASASATAAATVVQEGEEEKNAAAMNRSASTSGAAALTAQPIPTILQRGGSTVSSSMLRTAPTAEVPVTHQQLNTPTLCPALPSPPPFGLGPLPTLGGGAHSVAGSQLIQLSHARIMSSRRESRSQGTGLGTAIAASVAAAAAAATTSSTSGLATKHVSRYRRVRPRHRPAMVVARRRGYRGGPGGNGALRSQYSSFMKQRLLCLRINDKLTYIDPKRATGAAKLVADAALLAERLKRDEEKRMRQQQEKEERRRQRKKTAAAAATESAAGQRERLSDTNDALGEQGGEDGADNDATVPAFAAPRLYCPRCYRPCHRSHRRHHHSGHSQQQQQQQRRSPHSSLLHPTDAASQEQREEAKLERLSHPQSNRPRSAMASRPAVPQRHHSQRHSHSSKHKEKQQAHAQDSKQRRQAKRLASPDSSDVLSQNISGQWMLHGMPALARVTERELDVESMRSGSVHTSQQQHHRHHHHQDEQQPFGGGLACFAAQHSPAPKNAHAAARSFADSIGNATQRPPESATTSAVKSTTTAAAKSIASVHGFAVTSESPPRPQRSALVSRTAGRPSPPQPLQRHGTASSCHGTAAARHSSDTPGTPVIAFCALASANADAVAGDGQSEGSRHLTLHSEQTSWQYHRGGKDSNGEERSRGGGDGDDQGTLTAGPMTVLHSADGAVVSLSSSASAGAAAGAGDGVRFTASSPPPPPAALAAVAEGETPTAADCISATDASANVTEAAERLVASAVLNNTLYSTPLSRDMDGFPELEGRSLGSVHVPRSRTSSVHHSRPWANNVTAAASAAAAAVVSGGESGASVTASRAELCDDGRRGVGAGQSSMEKSELLRQSSGSSVLAAPAAFLAFPTTHASARNNNNNNHNSGRSSGGKNATPDLPCYTEGSFRFASENRQPSRGARYGGTASSSSMLPLGSPSAPAESGYVVHSRSASHSAVLPLQESAAPHLSAQHQPPQSTPQYQQQQQQLSQPQLRQRRYRSRSRPSRSGSQSARHRSSMTSFTVHYHPPQHHRRVSSSMSGAPDAEMTEEEMLNTALAAYPDFTPRSDSRAPSGRH